MAEFSEQERNKPKARRSYSELHSQVRTARRSASEVIEAMTGQAPGAWADEPLRLQSTLKMDQRFDIPAESTVLNAAMAVYRASRFADGSYLPPTEFADMYHEPPRGYSVGEELRQMDAHARTLAEAVRDCRRALRDRRDDVEGRDVKRLRHCMAVMKEVAVSAGEVTAAMDAAQAVLPFRRTRGGDGPPKGREAGV